MGTPTARLPRVAVCLLTALFVLVWNGARIGLAQEEEEGLGWVYGPAVCELGDLAKIDLPAGFQFVDGDGTRAVLEWLENPTSGRELGLAMPEIGEDGNFSWFVIFEYDPLGYVRDDDKDKLDADAILKSISEGTEQSNEMRRERGWTEVHVTGWHTRPYYDQQTNNLKWAIIGSSVDGESVNYSTRILGRGGAMSADLVISPEDLDANLGEYQHLLDQFDFTKGNSYAEFREGDKVAKYGLTALVAGGVGAVAMKTGLLTRLWKPIVIGFVALMSFLRRIWRRLLGRPDPKADSSDPDSSE